ncbi:hypothetical protein [Rhizobium sp. CF142]|nr:hypothetical protein [Rhizobium sp. CF142]
MSQASAFPDEKNDDLDDLCTQLMTLRQKVEAQMRTELTATIGSAE